MLPDEECSVLRSLFSPGSRKFWELKSHEARLLYIAILKHRDSHGMVEGRVKDLQALIPKSGWTQKRIEACCQDMISVGLLAEEETASGKYLRIVTPNGVQTQPAAVRLSRQSAEIAQPQSEQEITSRNAAHSSNALYGLGSAGKEHSNTEETPVPPEPETVYRTCRRIYRRYVGKSLGSLGPKRSDWNRMVNLRGAEATEAAMDIFARELGRDGRNLKWPLAVFMKQCDEFFEAVESAKSDNQTDEMPYLQPRP